MHESVVETLLMITAASPLIGFLLLGGALLADINLSEHLIGRLASSLTLLGLVTTASAGLVLVSQGHPSRLIELPYSLFGLGGGTAFLADPLSITMLLLAQLVTLVAANFSVTYLHRDEGYRRYFMLLMLFLAGADLIFLGGTLNVVLVGWELVGLSSVLLIGYFQFRSHPVDHGFYTFIAYKLCDLGLVAAMLMWPIIVGSEHLPVWGAAMGGGSPVSVMWLGLALLWAASGKSALCPWSSWLPRAMEGPTPSSAVFYGALSVHAGAYLLLRTWPVIGASVIVAIVVGLVGVITAAYGHLMGRARVDIKTQLAYATMSQVGVIVVEIALGLRWLPLMHIAGHVLLRTYQFLCSPSALHFANEWGGMHSEPNAHHVPLLARPSRWEQWLYRQALAEFQLEVVVSGLIKKGQWLAERCAAFDAAFLSVLMRPTPAAKPALLWSPEAVGMPRLPTAVAKASQVQLSQIAATKGANDV